MAALSKAQIEALTSDQANDLATAQVMSRVRFGTITHGPGVTTVPPSWADKKGTTDILKGDGVVEKAPNYELSRMPEETPDYLTDTWHAKLVAKMIRRGYKLELFQLLDGTFSAAFYIPPALPVAIIAADDRDAARRAALLAVQV